MKKLFSVRTILAVSLLLQLSTLCFRSYGAAGDMDLSFDPGLDVNGPVNAVAVQPDGKLIIGGQFTTVKGLLRTNLARLNADGSGDATFNPIGAYPVDALALQPDGKVLVGGQILQICDDFDCYDYTAVIRLNANGSLDSSFNPATAQYYSDYAQFRSLVVQSDGTVLIGGHFSTVNGTNRNGIARLNSNGNLDASFNPGNGASGPGWVLSIAEQSDGKVLIGGIFSAFDGTNRNGIARLNTDGSLDGSFNPGTELKFFDGYPYPRVESIVVQSDGKLIVAGYFTNVTGNSIARFNANGSLDSSFNSGTGPNGVVSAVAVQSDGKVVIIGGSHLIARFNPDGSLDTSFNPGTGADSRLNSVIVQSNGKLFINGLFTTVNDTKPKRIARLNADGSLDGSFDPGITVESAVGSLTVQPDGKVLVASAWFDGTFTLSVGEFTFVNGTNRYGSARLNADGSFDSTFMSTHFNPNLAALNQSNDCPPGYSCWEYTEGIAVRAQPDGKVLVSGDFVTVVPGQSEGEETTYFARRFLARFNADGSLDSSFNPGTGANGSVSSFAIQPDGKVLIGGSFTAVNGTNRNHIARLNANGSLDLSFNPGTGANGNISPIVLQPDGNVLIGGEFTNVNGTNRHKIARLNANGSLDSTFDPNAGISQIGGSSISAIALQTDGRVLIGGSLYILNGALPKRLARLNANGSLDLSFNPGTGPDGSVDAIALQPDGNVLIGGNFTTVNGVLRRYVARLYGDSVAAPLSITRSNAFVMVSWPVTGLSFQLQETTDLSLPNSWSPVAQPAVTNAGQISVAVPATVGRKFFRLKSQ